MDELTRDSVVVAVQDHVSSRLGDDTVILGLEDGVYYGLNPVGARIWQLIQTPISLGELQERLMEEYDVEAGQCEREVKGLVEDLEKHGLVEMRDGGPEEGTGG